MSNKVVILFALFIFASTAVKPSDLKAIAEDEPSAAAIAGHERNLLLMPSKRVIRRKMSELGLDHFLQKTRFDDSIAGKELYPAGVNFAVESAFYDYEEDLRSGGTPLAVVCTVLLLKPLVLESLLPKSEIDKLKKDLAEFKSE